ncbi:MAG: hypothetical protein LBH44_06305 [Treponema sp.]|jgi:flagellar motor component MotA|nr:hypothetical protein [Treponema sp.]
MNRNEFIKNYVNITRKVLSCAEKARREGLLSLEDDLDNDKINDRDIFEYGMRFVVDGTDSRLIDKILSNLISQEKDEYSLILKIIQKEAVLMIQDGMNPGLLYNVLNSYTDLSLKDDEISGQL